MSKQTEFINRYAKTAMFEQARTGIPASITLAQAILESGWGESQLSTDANNFFGIKAHNWSGPTYNINTGEYYDGGYTTVSADFRVYRDPKESFKDHSKFLKDNQRYRSLFSSDNYRDWAYGLKQAGYATSPTYAEKLINLIDQYELYQFDEKTKKVKRNLKIAGGITLVVIVFLTYKYLT